jgi:uncharacterized membrane protein (UPF0127 family)
MNQSVDLEKLQDDFTLTVYVDGMELADRIHVCVSSRARRQGLLGMRALGRGEGVLLVMPEGRRSKAGLATSIHTLGMRFPITVAWLSARGEIMHIVMARPWRPYFASPSPASCVLEVHPDHRSRLATGSVASWTVNGTSMWAV